MLDSARVKPERVVRRPSPPHDVTRTSSNTSRSYACAVALLDSSAVIAAAILAQLVRFGGLDTSATGRVGLSYLAVALGAAPAWVMTMTFGGAYDRRYYGWGTEEYRRVFDAAVRFLLVVALIGFLFKIDVARGFVALTIPVATVLTLTGRYVLRQLLHRMRRQGRFTKRVLVVGALPASSDVVRQLHSAQCGVVVVGACAADGVRALRVDDEGIPVFAEPRSALDAVVASQADVVAIADTQCLSAGSLRRLAWELEGTGVDLLVAPALTDVAGPRVSVRALSDIPLLLVEEPELKGTKRVVKTVFDRLVATAGLVALLPAMVAIAILVRVTSRGPALFRQVRVGLGGRHFVIWKFRTMAIDAEARLNELIHLNEHDGLLFKIRDDPRVTRIGRVLRRWSLDELPQLWNVIRGDMSIVGPRPPLPTEVERYDGDVRRRLLVKPGLTGLWQVGGRAGVPWEEAVRLDLYYVENWSLTMDAMILAKTVTAVLHGHGAC